jgi:hypothetical protein
MIVAPQDAQSMVCPACARLHHGRREKFTHFSFHVGRKQVLYGSEMIEAKHAIPRLEGIRKQLEEIQSGSRTDGSVQNSGSAKKAEAVERQLRSVDAAIALCRKLDNG